MFAFSMATTFEGKTWKTIQNRGLLKLLGDVCFSRATDLWKGKLESAFGTEDFLKLLSDVGFSRATDLLCVDKKTIQNREGFFKAP